MKICEKGEHCIDCPIIDDTAEPCQSCINVEPVVHCKDCQYSHMTYDGLCKYCDIWSGDDGEELYLSGDFFCGHAELAKLR